MLLAGLPQEALFFAFLNGIVYAFNPRAKRVYEKARFLIESVDNSRQTEGRGQANGHIDNIAADIILEKAGWSRWLTDAMPN